MKKIFSVSFDAFAVKTYHFLLITILSVVCHVDDKMQPETSDACIHMYTRITEIRENVPEF